MGNAGTLFKKARGTRIRSRLPSTDAHAEQKVSELGRNGDSAEIRGNVRWGSANKRLSTGFCLRSGSLRNSAITRGHACSSITWKAVRRTRIHPWVGQRSKATSDQTMEEESLQDGIFRAYCCPGISRQAPVPLRPPHRHRRTRQVHLQVQQQSEVTIRHQETRAPGQDEDTHNRLAAWRSRARQTTAGKGHAQEPSAGRSSVKTPQAWRTRVQQPPAGRSHVQEPPEGRMGARRSGGQRGGGPKGLGPKPRKSRGPKRWVPEGWGPKGGAEGWGARNFTLFFPSPAAHFRSLFSLSGGLLVSFFSLSGSLLVEFWWCFGRPGPSHVRVFALKLSCESPGGLQAAGAGRSGAGGLGHRTPPHPITTAHRTPHTAWAQVGLG